MARRAAAPLVAAGLASLVGCGGGGGGVAEGPAPAGERRVDAGAGVSVRVPRGWHLVRPPISAVSFPAERLLLTSYPTRGGGNCSPERAQRNLPPGGALVYLFEYRPERGGVWARLRRRDFPPRPARFRLRPRTLGGYECWRVPSYLVRFRAAGRAFQVHVALGSRASPSRRAQVLRVLDSLGFETLPPPPPDPYAGWPLLTTETGDSMRAPPGWPAAATTSPRRYRRPRTLFYAAERRLPGLPDASQRSEREPRRLPSPWPLRALRRFAADDVLLWVREERKGPASARFVPLPRREWPRAEDFRAVRGGPAGRWPGVLWQRAAAARDGHRFSVWVIRGPRATERGRALARKAAAALAFSYGRFRDTPCTRGCRTG